MCKSLNLNIVNGRKCGDLFGNYTCIKWNGNSVVDYLLTSAPLFAKISYFRVGEFLPWLSDHCPVHYTLELHNKKTSRAQPPLPKNKAPKQFVWTSKGKQKYLNMLKTEFFQSKLESSLRLGHMDPNGAVDSITKVLIDVAKKTKIKTTSKKGQEDPPWFDDSCRKLKEDVKLLGRKIKR